MPGDEVIVIKEQGGWRLVAETGDDRRFDFKVDAEEAALKIAKTAASTGRVLRVLVEDQAGALQPLKTT